MFTVYGDFLTALCEDAALWQQPVPLHRLPASQADVRHAANATEAAIPPRTLFAPFLDHASRDGAPAAVIGEGVSLSRAEAESISRLLGNGCVRGPASRRDRGRHDGKGLGTGRGRHGHPAGRGSLSARVPLPAGQAHRLHVQGCRCPLLLRAARPGSQGRSLRQRGRPRPPRLPGTSGPGPRRPFRIRTYRRRAWPMSSIPPAPQACPRG